MDVKETRKKLLIMECYPEFDHHSEVDLEDFMFLIDSEADIACEEYICESIWAFSPDFLANYLNCPVEVIQAIHDNGKCEDNNQIFIEWIEQHFNMDDFILDVIDADGRGHFLSSYDGEEHKVQWKDEEYYIYKIN